MFDNVVAETLMKRHNEELEALVDYKKELEALYEIRRKEVWGIKFKAQELCSHPEEREEEDYNYHKGESWQEVYCKVCDKYLRRY